jgi:hypothetical protein
MATRAKEAEITVYNAISAPVTPEMMYGSWNGKTCVLGNYVMRERGFRTGTGKRNRGESIYSSSIVTVTFLPVFSSIYRLVIKTDYPSLSRKVFYLMASPDMARTLLLFLPAVN